MGGNFLIESDPRKFGPVAPDDVVEQGRIALTKEVVESEWWWTRGTGGVEEVRKVAEGRGEVVGEVDGRGFLKFRKEFGDHSGDDGLGLFVLDIAGAEMNGEEGSFGQQPFGQHPNMASKGKDVGGSEIGPATG